MSIKIDLPENVRFIIDRFRQYGYRADIVGGSVRDALLGREIGDYDITTDCLPVRVKEIFAEYKILDTGIKHGTVTLLIGKNPYEITTYRLDGEYRDNRHPESVTFSSSLREDTSRRDFTVNAMCYNHYDGLTDYHGGLADLEKRMIRTVGESERRFDEDALRILRALRFSSCLGFDIEGETKEAIHCKKWNLTNVSSERIYAELQKLLSGRNAYEVLSEYADVFAVIIPEAETLKLPSKGQFDRGDFLTRLLSVFYLNCAEPVFAFDLAMRRLKTDNLTRHRGGAALKCYNEIDLSDNRGALISLYRFGEEAVADAMALGILLGRYDEAYRELLSRTLQCGIPYTLSALQIRGGDLISLGFKGARVGELLEEVLLAVIDGEVLNEREALINFVSQK